MGFRCQTISRNTLANANATRPWQIFADFAQHLIGIARPLYATEPFGVELDAAVYAFDASTIDLCLSVFPWAPFRRAKAAVKLHTLLDLRGNIPSFIHITDGKTHEVNVMDDLVLEAAFAKVTGEGRLGLGARTINYRLRATALVDAAGEAGITAPILIRGPWANPKISLDLEALAREQLEEEAKALEAAAKARAGFGAGAGASCSGAAWA